MCAYWGTHCPGRQGNRDGRGDLQRPRGESLNNREFLAKGRVGFYFPFPRARRGFSLKGQLADSCVRLLPWGHESARVGKNAQLRGDQRWPSSGELLNAPSLDPGEQEEKTRGRPFFRGETPLRFLRGKGHGSSSLPQELQ